MVEVRRIKTSDPGFKTRLQELLAFGAEQNASVEDTVKKILADVRINGDKAVVEYTERFDRRQLNGFADLRLNTEDLTQALERIPREQRDALEAAAERIRRFHKHQSQESWRYTEPDGTMLGQQVRPMDRVGLYVPGGKAAYPSSVLMNAIPAKVAGVSDLVMVSPAPDGQVNDMVLAAAAISGVDEVITMGGAQAVAAMAYGTESVAKVDKIVGPGNIFVATAKRQVFGLVDIDMIAGPSEILVVCDGKSNPDWIAMDLFSQAEHDEDAQSILISDDAEFIERVHQSVNKLLPTLARKAIAEQSLQRRGALIEVGSLEDAVELVNDIAPEHLELAVEDPESLLPGIRHAGAIFMGRNTCEALGDYCAGPNHVLPTSGTARFSSPLGVYDFQKRSSLIYCSAEGASSLGKIASVLARGESLEAHALSAEYRIKRT